MSINNALINGMLANKTLTNKMTFVVVSFILIFWWSAQAWATKVQVSVVDEQQQPIAWAVVYLQQKQSNKQTAKQKQVIIDQVDKEFIPYVTAIRPGDAINFPNNDNIRHQVYSFSKAKQFEIPLYSGNPSRPVTFDQTGAISMACNIHDWMSAYIYVVDSEHFIVTNELGQGIFETMTDGEYQALAWHPKINNDSENTRQKLTVAGQDSKLIFTLSQKPVLRAWRAPSSSRRRGY